jgi:F-type H+-transporting ATPase subunit b
MQIDWWTLALQTINLLVLVWILGRFLFRPIAEIIARRQDEAARVLEEAESARRQAEEAEQAVEKSAAEAAASRRSLIEAATTEASEARERLLEAARNEADHLRDEASAEIERMREAEAARSGAQASRLAVDIATRLFERLPDEARIAGFLDGLTQGLRDLPQAAREEFGAGGKAIPIKAARDLSAVEERSLREALSRALGREVALTVTVEPGLIAGLEIETPHAAVRNSFRDDLQHIADELTRDEPGRS